MKFIQKIAERVGWPMLVLIGLVAGYLVYAEIRERRRDSIDAEHTRLDAVADSKAQKAIASAEANLAIANSHSEAIDTLRETVGDLKVTVETMAKEGREITVRVEGETRTYEVTRNQSRRDGGLLPGTALSEREQRALAADAELYPQ